MSDNILSLLSLASNLVSEKEDLIVKESKIDREISDLYHYIEFTDLNVVAGFKIYKDLQDKLRIRRTIKNDLSIINSVLSSSLINVNKNSDKMFDNLNNLSYTPRERQDLFKTVCCSKNLSDIDMEFDSISSAADYLKSTKKSGLPSVCEVRKKINSVIDDKNKKYSGYYWFYK